MSQDLFMHQVKMKLEISGKTVSILLKRKRTLGTFRYYKDTTTDLTGQKYYNCPGN